MRAAELFGRSGSRFRAGIAASGGGVVSMLEAHLVDEDDPDASPSQPQPPCFELAPSVAARAMGWQIVTVGPITVIARKNAFVAIILQVDAQEDAPVGRLGAGTCGGSTTAVVDCAHEGLAGALRAALKKKPRSVSRAPS